MKYLIKIRSPGPDIESVTVPRVLIGRGIIQGSHYGVSFGVRPQDVRPGKRLESKFFIFFRYDFHTCLDPVPCKYAFVTE